MRSKQSGFAVVEVGLVLFFVAVVGVIGYMAYTNFMQPKSASTTADATTSPTPSPSTAPVVVKSTADLNTVSSQLDSISVDDSDSSTLDSSTAF